MSKTAEPGQQGPQDHLFQVQRSRALRGPGLSHQPLQKGPGTFVLDLGASSWGPGGTSLPTREAPGSTLPEATFRTCPGGQWVCGPGECRRMGGRRRDSCGGAGEMGFRPHPPGGAAPACPPRERSRCRPAHRTKPPAPTPPGRFAPVLPGHGHPQSLPPDSSASVPAPSGLSLPRPCLSLLLQLVPKSIA